MTRRAPAPPTTRKATGGLTLCALLACALAGGAGCADERPFQVGSGSSRFKDVEGGSVEVIYGAQGGSHIWISVRCETCKPMATVRFGIDDAETGELMSYDGLAEQVRLEEDDDGWPAAVGLTGFLSEGRVSFEGRDVRLWAKIEDDAGQTFEDAVETTISGSGSSDFDF